MKEIWKACVNILNYKVSNLGNIKHKNSIKNRKIYYKKEFEKGQPTGVVSIRIDDKLRMFRVHRLVAETFIANPQNKPTVNHIDGNRKNNKVSNLEWATQSENIKHAWDTRLNNGARNWTDEDLQKIHNGLEAGFSAQELSKVFEVDASSISDLIRGKTYKYNTLDFSKFHKSYYMNIARNDTNTIKELSQNGLNSERIGKMYNVSGRMIREMLR